MLSAFVAASRFSLAVAAICLIGGLRIPVAVADPAVHLACNDFPPLKIEHPGSNGLLGSDVDLLRELFRRTGVPLEISYLPWKRAFAAAQDGQVDGLCSCSYAADREADFLFSDEIGRVSVGIFSVAHSGSDSLSAVDSLPALKRVAVTGKTIGVVGGYALEEDIDKYGIPRDLASDDQRALDMLTGGRYDYLYSYEAPIKFLVKYPHPGQVAVPQVAYREFRGSPYFLCLSRKIKGNWRLLGALNKALAGMRKDGTIDRILDQYH
jgi:polar amino acid transport system substrate-binding protein